VVWKAVSEDDRKKGGNLEGVYKVDNDFYELFPTFDWFGIFTFSLKNPLTGKAWSKAGNWKHPAKSLKLR
jgi:hypothetical protein